MDSLQSILPEVKTLLRSNLRRVAKGGLDDIKARIDNAVTSGVSSSIVAISSQIACEGYYSSISQLIDSYGSNVRAARLRGSVFGEDHRALASAASQLLRVSGTADFILNMSSFETQLSDGFKSGTPIVVFIDDVQEFCRRNKQMLLYSLLDMLHNNKTLFVFIGLTTSIRFHELIEKRVSSRLSAAYLILTSLSPEEILLNLGSCLLLPVGEPDQSSSPCKKRKRTPEYDTYATRFNSSCASLLKDEHMRRLVAERVGWGYDIEAFAHLFEQCVIDLDTESAFITLSAFKAVLHDTEPQSLHGVVASLARIDVYLLIVITRLKALESATGAPNLQRVIRDFDALTNGKFDCEALHWRFAEGISNLSEAGLVSILCNGSSNMQRIDPRFLPSTATMSLVPPSSQIQALFKLVDSGQGIRVSQRARDAVLNPLLPILQSIGLDD